MRATYGAITKRPTDPAFCRQWEPRYKEYRRLFKQYNALYNQYYDQHFAIQWAEDYKAAMRSLPRTAIASEHVRKRLTESARRRISCNRSTRLRRYVIGGVVLADEILPGRRPKRAAV